MLRGLGTALSLPLLDSMVAAQTPLAKTAANPEIKLGLCFIPHGAVMANWTPAGEGADFKMSRTLAPVEPFRDQVVVVTNLAHKMAAPGGPGDNGGDHTRSPAVFLNGVHPKRTDGADIQRRRNYRSDRGRRRSGSRRRCRRWNWPPKISAGWWDRATWASVAPT